MKKKDKRTRTDCWYQDFTRFVQLKGLSERSRQSYHGWVLQLSRHFPDEHLPALPPARVLDFLIHLQNERKLAPATLNQAVCALRNLYRDHLGLDWDIWKKIHIKRGVPLPHVLTREEVALFLRTFRDGRYRAFCTVVYQCGLRLSEALAIKPRHINGGRLVIYIPKSKNRNAREVPITPRLLARLRRFYASHKNPEWLFPGVGRGWNCSGTTLREAMRRCPRPMNKSAVWAAIKVAKAECGLSKKHERLCTHTLRHSYGTHMLEGGASVRQVAAYLGHRTLKEVMTYLHLTEISESKGREALETLADC
jgi:integrase/recombinase XerD